jgi:hypothetical protein
VELSYIYATALVCWHMGLGIISVAGLLARISHRLTAEARDRRAITSLRLLAVLDGLREYACARQAARASY